jgi:formylglycine-generating enzyme required for sulfatase activity
VKRANFSETNLDAPSPVGVFPGDCTPEGVLDMAGNVLEWCLDVYDENYYQHCHGDGVVSDPSNVGDAAGPRVLRGGAFDDDAGDLRASGRYGSVPGARGRNVGFRCVLAPRRQP